MKLSYETPVEGSHSKLLLFIISDVSCTGSALAAQQAYVSSQQGFGEGDTTAFAFWLVQLAVVVGMIALALGTIRCRVWIRYALSLIMGLLSGFAWTWFVAVSLGPWYGLFSFNPFHFWTLGAVVGIAAGSVYVHLATGGRVRER